MPVPRRPAALPRRTGRLRLRLPEDLHPDLALRRAHWLLRALLQAGAVWGFLQDPDSDPQQPVLAAVGLPGLDPETVSPQDLRRRLAGALKVLPAPTSATDPQARNVAALAQRLALNPVEQALLLFASSLHSDELLETVTDGLGAVTNSRLAPLLGVILDQPPAAIANALSVQGMLFTTGLVRMDTQADFLLKSKLDILQGLPGLLEDECTDPDRIFAGFVQPALAPTLSLRDYRHLRTDTRLLGRLLGQAVRQRTAGVNVLLYGPPGTGKTELARTLAAAQGLALYEVSVEDRDGEPLTGRYRLDALRLGQHWLRQRNDCVLLFDEVEDVFPDAPVMGLGRGDWQRNKGWMNHLLETNPVPALWISNRIETIDPAFLRRFDLVLKMDIPPQTMRRRILAGHLDGVEVGRDWVTRMAARDGLSPAHMARAVRVARLVGLGERTDNERCLEQVLGHNLAALGHAPPPPAVITGAAAYDPALVNADLDLAQVARGLARTGRGRLCLYGPPGTGKSAYAAYLAQTLHRPLLAKRASDLLGAYVGETEAGIAAMFREAQASGAVLLLDEADSFLQDRSGARQQWEVTQVNELLVQMEAFQGLFVCTTNLMERLDPAVLRRFDLKVRLGYLRPEQVRALVEQTLRRAGTWPRRGLPAQALTGLQRLETLTPGDGVTVTRKLEVLGESLTFAALLAALDEELRAKPEARRRPIGFIT